MLQNVNPTRMELLKLKQKREIAYYGHRLLKEKRDSLMKEFLKIIKETYILAEKIEKEMGEVLKNFTFAFIETRPEFLEEAFLTSQNKVETNFIMRNIMNVNMPHFEFKKEEKKLFYSLVFSNSDLDLGVQKFSEIIDSLLKLAELKNSAFLLSLEIEKTRRRVNALEYVLIPSIEETIRYITRKLEEQERSNIIALMKIKANITSKK